MAFLQEVGVRAVVKGYGPYQSQIRSMDRVTQKFGLGIGKALGIGAKIGAVAIAGLGIASVKAFADFDAAMTKSLAIMGDVSDKMRTEMSDAAREVAKTTTFSANQAAESYFFLASAGLDAAQSVAAMPKVAAFAQAGMFDMALATDLLTDAQSALGLTIRNDVIKNIENMVKVSDVLVKANTLANATVEQFSTALTREAGSAMKSFKIDIEEGVAVLAAFADQGIKGEIAGTGLSRILRLMTAGAEKNAEAYKRLNVAVFDAFGNLRNLADIISDLENAFRDLSDEQRVAALSSLGFQARVQGIILPLIGTSDAIRRYEAGLRDATGITAEIAEKQLRTFSAQLSLLSSNLNDVFIELGSNLVPMLVDLNKEISEHIIPVLQDWAKKHGPDVAETIKIMAKGVKDTAIAVGDLVKMLRENERVLLIVATAFITLFAAANPLLAILAGTSGLVFMMGLLSDETRAVKVPMNEAQRAAQGLELAFLQMAHSILEAIHTVQLFSPLLALLGPKGAAVAATLIVTFDEVGETLGRLERRIAELQRGINFFDAAPMVAELGEVIGWAHSAEAALSLIPIYSGEPVSREVLLQFARPAPTGLEATFMQDMGRAAKRAFDEGLNSAPPPSVPPPDTGAAAAVIDELTRFLSGATLGVNELFSALDQLLGLETTESLEERRQILELQLKAFDLETKAIKAREARGKKVAELERKIELARKQGDEKLLERLQARKKKEEDVLSPAEQQLEIIQDQIDAIRRLGEKRRLENDLLRTQAMLADASLLTDQSRMEIAERIVDQIRNGNRETGFVVDSTLAWRDATEDVASTYEDILATTKEIARITPPSLVSQPQITPPFGPQPEHIMPPIIPAPFHAGGVVPGPLGQPALAMVLGGERITPAGGPSFAMPISVSVQGLDWAVIKRTVHVEVDQALEAARSDTTRAGSALGSGIG